MPVHRIIVGVALTRPPATDEYRLVLVEAATRQEAILVAAQMASCTSVMAVSAVADSSPQGWMAGM